ncbi:MAG: S24 family peptidase [Firmicutes bacterium]|nr:S24 family peptidase [Bacillota bacterium]
MDYGTLEEEQVNEQVQKNYELIKKMPISKQIDFVINRYVRISISDSKYIAELGAHDDLSKDIIIKNINAMSKMPIIRIKVLDLITGEENYDWILAEKVRFGEYIYIIAPDDSMSGVHITKGSKILCKTSSSLESEVIDFEAEDFRIKVNSGKIYLINHQEQIIIRRVFIQNNQPITLQSENPKYPPIIVNENDDFEIFGIVISTEFNPNQE